MKCTQIKGWKDLNGMSLRVFDIFSQCPKTINDLRQSLGRESNSRGDLIRIKNALLDIGYLREVPGSTIERKRGNVSLYYETTEKPFAEFFKELVSIYQFKLTEREINKLRSQFLLAKKSRQVMFTTLTNNFKDLDKLLLKDYYNSNPFIEAWRLVIKELQIVLAQLTLKRTVTYHKELAPIANKIKDYLINQDPFFKTLIRELKE